MSHLYVVACDKTNTICPFFTFPRNSSASLPYSVENLFYQRYLVSYYFSLTLSLYYRTYYVYGSITVFTRYHVKGSSSICVAILCVAIGIIGTIWFIYFILLTSSWVTIDNWFSITLGVLPGFLFFGVSICVSLGSTLGGIPDLILFLFTLGVGAYFWCFLVGYWCITCARTCSGFFSTSLCLPLCLFVDCCYYTLGIKLNSSARFLSAVWGV